MMGSGAGPGDECVHQHYASDTFWKMLPFAPLMRYGYSQNGRE